MLKSTKNNKKTTTITLRAETTEQVKDNIALIHLLGGDAGYDVKINESKLKECKEVLKAVLKALKRDVLINPINQE